jgi:hypothetical protein
MHGVGQQGNGEGHLAQTVYPSCEKCHTHYTANMRGPSVILVTQFTLKIKLTTFRNEQSKILRLRFEGKSTTHVTPCQDD